MPARNIPAKYQFTAFTHSVVYKKLQVKSFFFLNNSEKRVINLNVKTTP